MIQEWLKSSKHTVIFTGAGMSTESGVPDFRSAKQGLWQQKDPSKVASIDALTHTPEEFTDFYRKRMTGLKEYHPHTGHQILAEWEKSQMIQSIITQNVDGFHQQAGNRNVMELHGSLRNVFCQSCETKYDQDDFVYGTARCDKCGGMLRPAVVLFGEMLPQETFQSAFSEAEQADLFIVLGSSLTVSPANQIPIVAKENGARLVIVNQEATPLDEKADQVINHLKIGEVLSDWDNFLKSR